uniref:CCHC-type domain-containing protein n=1 Tax=Caenorhabditis japonica TaxID=281687 RepID=A0A8R1HWM9_CAEJA
PDITTTNKRRRHNNTPSKGHRCAFCEGPHISDTCSNVKEWQERRKILEGKEYGPRCIHHRTQGHACRPKDCYYCGKKSHHSSICQIPDQ